MSINITDKPEVNVVNVGDELSQDQINAITSAEGANGMNHFVTVSDSAPKTVFREAVLYNELGVSSITINSQDFANGFTRDIVGEAITASGAGYGITQKFIIFLRAPTQGIASPSVQFKLFDGDTASVKTGTATLVGSYGYGNYQFKASTPESGFQTRYEWQFELTPTGMANPARVFPDVSFITNDSNSGNWEFTFVWEASIPA